MPILLRKYQEEAIQAVRDLDRAGKYRSIVNLPTGCHARGQHLLMFDGSIKAVEDVQVNDLLMGPDSMPRRVLALARGFGEMVRVTPIRGTSFTVNRDHVLTLVKSPEGKKSRYPSCRGGIISDVSVRDWQTWAKSRKWLWKLFHVPVTFAESSALPLDPYFLGALLGDGSIQRGITLWKPDDAIRDLAYEQARRFGLKVRVEAEGTSSVGYSLTTGRIGGRKHPIVEILRLLGVHGTTSDDKFIPRQYKVASREERLQLLAGLMDTDGHHACGGYDFVSKSKRLAEDTAFVARSVGLFVSMSPCEKRDQHGHGGTYYRLTISGDCSIIPCRIPRKKCTPRRQIKNPLRSGFSVEELPPDHYYGFTLDGDGRYLLDDFTVTHNTGKTCVAITMVASALTNGHRVLWLAHREELVDQAIDTLHALAPEHALKVGIVKADRDEWDRPFVVASCQTLWQEKRLSRVMQAAPPFALVVWDEAHHASSISNQRIMAALPSDAAVVGLTATIERGDGGNLAEVFPGGIAYQLPLLVAIRDGYLVPFTPIQVRIDGLDLSNVGTVAGDFNQSQLGEVMEEEDVVRATADAIVTHARDRKSLVFTVTVAQAAKTRDELATRGIPARVVSGDTPIEERREILRDFRTGKVRAIANCNVLTEGYDEPSADCVVIARPTRSKTLYLQMVGRGLRLAPGKRDCIAEGQRVLTDHGLVPIERISIDMKVWDGVEFVNHGGAVCRGAREVVTYAGLTATPDHRVWTKSGWKSIRDCITNETPIVSTGEGRTPLREIDGYIRGARDGAWDAAPCGHLHDMRGGGDSQQGSIAIRCRRVSEVRQPFRRPPVATDSSDRRETEMLQPVGFCLLSLRREGDRIQIRESCGHGGLGDEKSGFASGFGIGQDQQRRTLRTGQSALGHGRAEPCQQQEAARECGVSCFPYRASGSVLRGCDSAWIPVERKDRRGNRRAFLPPIMQTQGRVWDILNAGPRHRFTVEGLLVSNCLVIDLMGATARHSPIQAAALIDEMEREATALRMHETGCAPPCEAPRCRCWCHKLHDGVQGMLRADWTPPDWAHWTELEDGAIAASTPGLNVIVWRDGPEDEANVWHCTAWRKGRGRIDLTPAPVWLDLARGIGEDVLRRAGGAKVAKKQAAWRERPASEGQIAALRRFGVEVDFTATRGEAADLLTKAISGMQWKKLRKRRDTSRVLTFADAAELDALVHPDEPKPPDEEPPF